jgi:hypothetical protein
MSNQWKLLSLGVFASLVAGTVTAPEAAAAPNTYYVDQTLGRALEVARQGRRDGTETRRNRAAPPRPDLDRRAQRPRQRVGLRARDHRRLR